MKKGVSLVVLIITIIVLVILTTTIVLNLQQNNIIEKAQKATTSYNVATTMEAVILAVTPYKIKAVQDGKTVLQYLKDNEIEITQNGLKQTIDETANTMSFSKDDVVVTTDSNGNITATTEKVKEADIPYGAFVIYNQGEQEVPLYTPLGNRTGSWTTPLNASFEEKYIHLYEQSGGSWRSCSFRTTNKIDVTEYTSMGFVYEIVEPPKGLLNNTYYGRFLTTQLSTSTSLDYNPLIYHKTEEKGIFKASMDISSYTGEQYVKFMLHTATGDGFTYTAYDADVRILKIWLE